MRGKFYDTLDLSNFRFFKQNNKNNLFLVSEKDISEKKYHFFNFFIFLNGEQIFEPTKNILQALLACENFLKKNKNSNPLCIHLDEEEEPFIIISTNEELFSIYNNSKDLFLKYRYSDNTCIFNNENPKVNIFSLTFYLYSILKPGRSTLKLLEDLKKPHKKREFIHYSNSMESEFSNFKSSLNIFLKFLNDYLNDRNFPMNIEQIFFTKIRSEYTSGRYIRHSNTIKIDLLKTVTEDRTFSTLCHEVGHSFDYEILKLENMHEYINLIKRRLPNTSSYERSYLQSDVEIIARTIQTDFLMYIYGENPYDNPNKYLNHLFTDNLKKIWFMNEHELDVFHQLIKEKVLL